MPVTDGQVSDLQLDDAGLDDFLGEARKLAASLIGWRNIPQR